MGAHYCGCILRAIASPTGERSREAIPNQGYIHAPRCTTTSISLEVWRPGIIAYTVSTPPKPTIIIDGGQFSSLEELASIIDLFFQAQGLNAAPGERRGSPDGQVTSIT